MKLKSHRFSSSEISLFLSRQHKISTPFFSIFYSTDHTSEKFAFISPKRIGGAVVRNRIRRQLKSQFYAIYHQLKTNVRLIIIANQKMIDSDFNLTANVLLLSLKKKDLLQ
ncbi:MAG: ribonuclease P protein component [Candidatus Marinamargulisbacteria bacterium]